MSQYTSGYPHIPPVYPLDMVAENYDPYLDGAYTAPLGSAADLFIVEPFTPSHFVGTAVVGTLEMTATQNAFSGVGAEGVSSVDHTLGALNSIADALIFNGLTTLSGLSTTATLLPADDSISISFNRTTSDKTISLTVLSGQMNIGTIQNTFTMGELSSTTTLGTITATKTLSTINGSFSRPTLQTTFTLKD